jgi:stringent starvation protein B
MRALYEWCVDNGYTPYVSVVVDANTRVPVEYVRNGEIVLNIGPLAANKLKIGTDYVEFVARFGGTARELIIPVSQVGAIYARENGQGMSFPIERETDEQDDQSAVPSDVPPAAARQTRESSSEQDESAEPPAPPANGGKPTLRIVK